MTDALLQITAPHFCAGLVIENDKVVRAAPILHWMMGRPSNYVRWYVQRKKGWLLTIPHHDGTWEFAP